MDIKIKICCISSIEEAHLAIQTGANALGLVSEMPSGPGVISESAIASISQRIPDGISSFLLTSKIRAEDIISQHQRCPTNTIQLVDAIHPSDYPKIKEGLPGVRIVQVIHVLDESSEEEAIRVSPHVDALLLDSGNPNLAVKELGGTGRTHNWKISRRIVESVPIPVYLAGGLHADNVCEAIDNVQPFGVDVCSGVRTGGKLDRNKLVRFVEAVRAL